MTVETDIDSLVTAVTSRKDKAVSSKAQLTANVADALSARDQAEDAANATLSIRDEASGLTTVSGATATASVGATSYADLKALAASKAETAVDVFVYDTSLDSDGGAWRYRTTGTSWYSETFGAKRGSKKEFPAVAVIVAELDRWTIYDGDDPSLPLWMQFIKGQDFLGAVWQISCIYALNGIVAVGMNNTYGNIQQYDFIKDRKSMYRNAAVYNYYGAYDSAPLRFVGGVQGSVSVALVSEIVNDVAMTVLPDAPVDPATGLPVPTIAVATAGGVSVIKHDGTVVDIAGNYGASKTGFFGEEVLFQRSRIIEIGSIPEIDTTESAFDRVSYWYNGVVQLPIDRVFTGYHVFSKPMIFNGGPAGLAVLLDDETGVGNGPEGSMVAYVASNYNSGWLNGDIRGAFLSDTDDTDLVPSGELVTNGDFSSTTGWSGTYPNDNNLQVVGGQLVSAAPRDGNTYSIRQTLTGVKAGQTIEVTVDVASVDAVNGPRLHGYVSSLPYLGVGVNKICVTALVDNPLIGIETRQTTEWVVNSISATLVDADRSYKNNGLTVNGTVTRSPVAEGAELVAYSGFGYTGANYLYQPYNADLAFGSGDFSLMWWNYDINTVDQNRHLLGLYDPTTNIYRLSVYHTVGGTLRLRMNNLEYGNVSGAISSSDKWDHIAYVRINGVLKLYVNGVELHSSENSINISTSTNDEFRVGYLGSLGANFSRFALLRISATAPTAEQIRKIYEDEKHLFQPGAKCTLYGTSDAVTALAHDPVTNLLHVGTSAGRSVFDGLVRVDNTTTAVGTAISAVNGFVVEE